MTHKFIMTLEYRWIHNILNKSPSIIIDNCFLSLSLISLVSVVTTVLDKRQCETKVVAFALTLGGFWCCESQAKKDEENPV